MAAPIGPGDWVECVDSRHPLTGEESIGLRKGAVYRVVMTAYLRDARYPESVILEGCLCPGNQLGAYGVRRFRPIWRGDKSLIQTLLEPIKEDTRQPEHA